MEADQYHLQRFSVNFEYSINFTHGVFESDSRVLVDAVTRIELNKRHRTIVFVDEGVVASWPDLQKMIEVYFETHSASLQLIDVPYLVPGGEGAKNDPDLVVKYQQSLLEQAVDRHSFILAIGGGAMLDLIGYVAAIIHRGIRFIRMPTTVLSQADSGVSVKNGINAFGVKNLIGTFSPPFAVINDFDFISTLSNRDKVAGMAESVKVALLRDQHFFEWLEEKASSLCNFEPDAMAYLIQRGAELHLEQIVGGGDPFEFGNVRPLDYGHWAAHKLESLSKNEMRHGEAVAIGLALDTRYSYQKGLLSEGDAERVFRLLERLGFALWSEYLDISDNDLPIVFQGLQEFCEHLGGALCLTMLVEIGRDVEVHEIDEAEMFRAITWLKVRYSSA